MLVVKTAGVGVIYTAAMTDNPTAAEALHHTAKPVLEFGRGWMLAEATVARSIELGLDGPLGFWANGRAGVLGEVDADLAAAAIGFMSPTMVRKHWETPCALSHGELADEYAGSAASWGRAMLADMDDPDLERLGDLANKIAAAADSSTGMLFAGWRALAQPDDPAGRATVALNVVREMRGGAHLSAAHAVGLGPHACIMSTDDPARGGASWAETFGWPAPHPTPDAERRLQAEAMTDVICLSAFEALDDDERHDWVRLVTRARAAMDNQ